MIQGISKDTESAMSVIIKQDGVSMGYQDLASCDCIVTKIARAHLPSKKCSALAICTSLCTSLPRLEEAQSSMTLAAR